MPCVVCFMFDYKCVSSVKFNLCATHSQGIVKMARERHDCQVAPRLQYIAATQMRCEAMQQVRRDNESCKASLEHGGSNTQVFW